MLERGAGIVKQAHVQDRVHNFNKIKITLGPIHKHIGLIAALVSLNVFSKITSWLLSPLGFSDSFYK